MMHRRYFERPASGVAGHSWGRELGTKRSATIPSEEIEGGSFGRMQGPFESEILPSSAIDFILQIYGGSLSNFKCTVCRISTEPAR